MYCVLYMFYLTKLYVFDFPFVFGLLREVFLPLIVSFPFIFFVSVILINDESKFLKNLWRF